MFQAQPTHPISGTNPSLTPNVSNLENPTSVISTENGIALQNLMNKHEWINACGLGVEPGITSPNSAENILKEFYGQVNVLLSLGNSPEQYTLLFDNRNSPTPTYAGSLAIVNNQVDGIIVGFDETLIIDDVIFAVGEPDTVALYSYTSNVPECLGVWDLIYFATGLELQIQQASHLEGTSPVVALLIFNPLTQNNKRNQNLLNDSKLLPWQGYNVDYCLIAKATDNP